MATTFLFEFNWTGDGATWVDESDYVFTARLRLGYAFEVLEESQVVVEGRVSQGEPVDARVAAPGAARVVMDNSSQRFSPDNAGGALYGNLVPRRPVRVRATDGITTWTIWRGYVDAIVPEAGPMSRRMVWVTAVDALSLLGGVKVSLALQQNKRADQLIAGAVNLAFGAPYAYGTVQFGVNPSGGDFYQVGNVKYTFVVALSGAANEVKIGAKFATSMANLLAAITQGMGVGTAYASTTDHNTEVTAVLTYPGGIVSIGGTAGFGFSIGDVGGVNKATSQTMFAPAGRITVIGVNFGFNTGAPVGNVTWKLRRFDDDSLVGSGTFVPVANSFNAVTIVGGPETTTGVVYRLSLEATQVQSSNNCWNVSASGDAFYAGGQAYLSNDGGQTWTPQPGWDLMVYLTADSLITCTALLAGAAGNAITQSKSGTYIAISGATLSGGVDAPAGLTSYEAGSEVYDVAGDRWVSDQASSLDVIRDCVNSELGYFFVQRDGLITFYNRRHLFKAASAVMSVNADPFALSVRRDPNRVYNVVRVMVHPRATAGATAVLAASSGVLKIPAQVNGVPGSRVVTLAFRDGAGSPCGATALVLPLVPTTDYTVNERRDGTSVDYTNDPAFKFGTWVVTGSEITIPLLNYATGPLYVTKLQIRGKPITVYDPVVVQVEDLASEAKYLRRVYTLDLPLSADESLGSSIARYVLDHHAEVLTEVTELKFEGVDVAGGVNVFSLGLFDLVAVTDSQTALTSVLCHVVGYRLDINSRGFVLVLRLRRANAQHYWMLGRVGYGELGTNTRLAV